MALAESQPADACRQPLECDPLARHPEPALQMRVVRKELHHLAVRLVDVFGIAGKRHPAERSLAFAEERPDVRGHETGERERVGDAFVERDLADVVAVVERRDALRWNASIAFTCATIDCFAADTSAACCRGSSCAAFHCSTVQPGGQIAVARDRARKSDRSPCRAARRAGRARAGFPRRCRGGRPTPAPCLRARVAQDRERVVEVLRLPVEVARREAHLDPALLALDREHRCAGHRRRQRLRAAHPAQPGGQDPFVGKLVRRSAGGQLRRTSRRCPGRCPGCRCRSRSPPSSGRTS